MANGTHLPWWDGPMAAFDTETTGADPRSDQIVTAAIVVDDPDTGMTTHTFLLNTPKPSSAEAVAVHGVTPEHAAAHGLEYRNGIEQVVELISAISQTMPIATFNGAFDFTILDTQARALDLTPPRIEVVLDALVMDRIIDPRRRGKRRLCDVTAHYGVALDNAHEATADATAALLLARDILRRYPTPQTPAEFHASQRIHRANQERDRQVNLRRWRQDPTIVCEPGWPLWGAPASDAAA